MSLGKRPADRQKKLWMPTHEMVDAPGHPFYRKLNEVLARGEFDRRVEELCEPYYAEKTGRPSVPPGVYFRMMMVGYFEDIDSQRGIAWRCADSLSLRSFLGYPMDKKTPDHSSLTRIRKRLPLEVHQKVFQMVLSLAAEEGLLEGRTIGVDATTLEANAAMKSIVRKDTGEDWTEYVKSLMEAEEDDSDDGDGPTDEDARRYDRKRGSSKKVSNEDWESPSDPDARITKMKDGRTDLAYKAEHAVDLETDAILAADVRYADEGDADGLLDAVEQAEENAREAQGDSDIEDSRIVKEAVADKGYHKAETLADCREADVRTYIPERNQKGRRRWTDKPPGWQQAFYRNRYRTRGKRGKRLQRKRSERLERSFAHLCEAGGLRRMWLRGLREVKKRYLVQAAAHNLGLIMRKLCGAGKPRALAGVSGMLRSVISSVRSGWHRFIRDLLFTCPSKKVSILST